MPHTRLAEQISSLMTVSQHGEHRRNTPSFNDEILRWMVETFEENATKALQMVLQEDTSSRVADSPIAHAVLVGSIRRLQSGTPWNVPPRMLQDFRQAYQTSDALPAFQSLVLRCLITMNKPQALRTFAELIASSAPRDARLCLEIFGHLLKSDGSCADALFPPLLAGLREPRIAPLVLDYANFAFRNHFVALHPATDQVDELSGILGHLADRLGAIQDQKPESDEQAKLFGKQVTEAVSLGVALCDALACIGNPVAVGCLNKALGVEHRRLRVEAAAALAKLDVEDARALLVAMAADPVERLRVLQYAEELDLLDRVDDEFSNVVARAEAEFVTYLAQPSQFGIAPQHVELIDQRELAWPGYEEPRNCYLFRFVYQFPMGEFSNIGIAGPLVRAIQPDLRHLPHDNIYAIFAGWHVDHPDIFAFDANRTVGTDQWIQSRMLESLQADDYEDVQPVLLAKLLDQNALIASATRCNEHGWAIVSEHAVSWIGIGSPQAPLGAEDVFHLFVGQALLRSFN